MTGLLDIWEHACIIANPLTMTRTHTIPSRRHSQSCPECKTRVHQLLERIYGTCVRNHRFRWGTGLADYAGSPIGSTLQDVAQALQEHRGFGIDEFVLSKKVAACDYWVPDPGFIVEFDESQHFTKPRSLALSVYAGQHPLGFSAKRWLQLCEEHSAKDGSPPYRDEQRAWYDTLRDLVPVAEGLWPTVRLYARDRVWCSLDPESRDDRERFLDLIHQGPTSRTTPEIRFPTVPPAQPGQLVNSLRRYVANRLVIEGGFDPDWIWPRPPITVDRDRDGLLLSHDPDAANADRLTLPGALKAAKPDVTVTVPTIGPVLALSLEGTESVAVTRDRVPELTGGLERIAGACVNLHMIYPALVYGFWHVIGASRVQDLVPAVVPEPVGDLGDRGYRARTGTGEVAAELRRYHGALARLSERGDIRDDPSRYEACALTLVEHSAGYRQGIPYPDYPPPESLLDYNRMFRQLYAIYDRRFVESTLSLRPTTERRVWHRDSPLLVGAAVLVDAPAKIEPRVAICPPNRPRNGAQQDDQRR